MLKVEIPHAKIDMDDFSPLGHVKMQGVAEIAKLSVGGKFGDPHSRGRHPQHPELLDRRSAFGNVTQGHVELHKLTVDLREVHAQKGKSTYELTTGELDFGGRPRCASTGR